MAEEAVDQTTPRKGVRKDNFTLSAMRLNNKEDRLLHHKKHMLSAESAYVLRMMDMSEKVLVVRFKNLRERLSRQRSNLTAEELETFRRSETPSSRSCFSRSTNTSPGVASTPGRWYPQAGQKLPRKRSKSANGASLEQSCTSQRSKSAANHRCNTSMPRSVSVPVSVPVSSDVLPQTARPNELSQYTARHQLLSAPAKLPPTEGKKKYLSGPMVELALEEDRERKQRSEDHRRRMLQRSRVASADLLQKKDDFLKRLDLMMHDDTDNILEQIASGQFDETAQEQDDEETRKERELRRKRRMRFRNIDRNEKTELLAPEEYWKNINKCRYLRLPDGTEDLSGVVTLVSEQRKLFQVWRDNV